MLYQLKIEDYHKIKSLVSDLKNHPVINGVLDGHNRGKVIVDDPVNPESALIWAINEMFFLVGSPDNKQFHTSLESYIIDTIKPEALSIGDDDFNLEMFPFEEWDRRKPTLFPTIPLLEGVRVSFVFQKERFLNSSIKQLDSAYQLKRIDQKWIHEVDSEELLQKEILKFWPSLNDFFETGIGYTVLYGNEVISSCISVYITGKEHEIGINTYRTEHRGKGVATAMAHAFIKECLQCGYTPHWTTEIFRKDSIAIAEKVGFEKVQNYKNYFVSFRNMI